ncbi:piggyBac transposable element-derived protein 4-like [Onthophagus taurus]|uniref:piggyBac transposable element-derived protein 4-like n=1 Tax=Onthophagus taurus TaxID=166361 RepID=UPI0039BE7787
MTESSADQCARSAKARSNWERNRPLSQKEVEKYILESESDSDTCMKVNSESEISAVEDHVEYSEHDTDTQESDDSEENVASSPTHGNYYCGKDRTTKWYKVPPPKTKTQKYNIITHLPGCKGPAKNVTTPAESFILFFDEFVLDLLIENTNKYIIEVVKDKFSRTRDARLVTKNEIKAFLGLLIAGGVMRSSHLNFDDLFSADDMGNEFFYTTMSKQRFLFILRCVRFDEKATRAERQETDKLAAIRVLFDYIVNKCGQLFTPSEYLTVDEQLVAFRGHCNFRQYMPSKPNKYGIKIFALVDAKNFYNLKMEVYLGTQPDGPFKVSNSPGDVVIRLISPISKSGRNITVDNWFTSIPLADNLLKNHKVTLVGTVRKNKREIPVEFQPNRTRAVKSTLFGFTTTTTMMSYVPKKGKSVILLSTLHKDATIDKESENALKPEECSYV